MADLPREDTGSATAKPNAETPAAASAAPSPETNKVKDGAAAAKQARPSRAVARLDQLEKVGALSWLTLVPSWLASLTVHLALLIILALIVEPLKQVEEKSLVALPSENTNELQEVVNDTPQSEQFDQTNALEAISLSDQADGLEITEINELAAAPKAIDLSNIGLETAPISDLSQELGKVGGRGLEGRGDAARKSLVASGGGTAGSENAVANALAWLAAHQAADGGWSFDHRVGKCQGRCRDPGRLEDARIAATGLALLPFLGAGQTHLNGKYKKTVQTGLYFLINRMKIGSTGGDLWEPQGRMYGHGIATIALCEAYAMTKDRDLAEPAQQAINFIVSAQDQVGGGWRYNPGEPGDTSVVGWQMMALKSAHMAYLNVPAKTIKGASNFLNSVQQDKGAVYGYLDPGNGAATTAIGLLCRMYLGWKRDEPALGRGVQLLSDLGPSEVNMYYNYYTTQVMHHYEGEAWTKWNEKMRDLLVRTQATQGHERGSWYFSNAKNTDHSEEMGGRLYSTALASMTLEVYYRHLPIYQRESAESSLDE